MIPVTEQEQSATSRKLMNQRFSRSNMDKTPEDFDVIWANEPDTREWQCIECGYVKESKTRPKSCPDCNCVNGDFDLGVNLFARRELVGWFE